MQTDLSASLADRLRHSLPGGDTRSATFYEPYPVAFDRGEGHIVYDVDGNAYADFWNNYTSLAHGHAHPKIVAAVQAQLVKGTAFPGPHAPQGELAERICARVPSIELLRYTNSGSEGVMLAVRAARAATGRDLIVKAEGGYHGCWEQVPMSQGAGIGSAGGTPDAVTGLLRWCEYNDIASLTAVMEANGEQIAAILLEPVMTGAGIIAADPEFFRAARELCDRYGALLIADEVVTLRLDIGGQQTALGVEADLTVLGKIIGGGLPVGATGGRAEVLELFDPRRPGFVGHSGTFNGNPLTAVAGAASLDLLPADEITRINGLGDRLATAFKGAIEQAEVDGTVTRAGSLVQLHFETGGPVRAYRDTNMSSKLLSHVHRASLEEGLLFAARGLMCVSTAMDEAVIDEAAASFSRALAKVKDRQLTGVTA